MGVTPKALLEGNETTSTWYYEPDRTPRILEILHRANLQVRIVVEPSRHMDAIQDPGLFNDVKETVARASIVNPDLVPPPNAGETAGSILPMLPHQPIAAAVRQVLESPPASRSDGAIVNSAVVFRSAGDAEEADGGARTLAVMSHRGVLCFALKQPQPSLGQVLDRRPIPRPDDGMIRHNIHTFGNIPRLHGAVAQVHM